MFTVTEYRRALTAVIAELTERDLALLRAQYAAPDRTVTVPELAAAVGLSHYQPVNRSYGALGRRLAPYLGAPPDRHYNGGPAWFSYLSAGRSAAHGYLWRMYLTLAQALEELGLVPDASLPEEVSGPQTYHEGAVRQVTVNAYERNPQARTRCIEHHGTRCVVCGFDFGAVYGPAAEGYIHVHHLRPLGAIAAEYEVDPVEDLRPVCPNCHAVIHRRVPAFSIEEVRAMLRRSSTVA
jgi:5-methylcytosine-specific restriction protein A